LPSRRERPIHGIPAISAVTPRATATRQASHRAINGPQKCAGNTRGAAKACDKSAEANMSGALALPQSPMCRSNWHHFIQAHVGPAHAISAAGKRQCDVFLAIVNAQFQVGVCGRSGNRVPCGIGNSPYHSKCLPQAAHHHIDLSQRLKDTSGPPSLGAGTRHTCQHRVRFTPEVDMSLRRGELIAR
jgi:hypothetical protein